MSFVLAPPAGLEPATSWLTVMRSTDWAKEEYRVLYTRFVNLRTIVCFASLFIVNRVLRVKASTLLYLLPLCWHWPIFPDRCQSSIVGITELNFCVRNGNRWTLCVKITDSRTSSARFCLSACVSVDLSSRLVSKQVLSAQQSLTSVFGMGTGGPFALKTLTIGAPSGIRTRDPLIKSQLLYQLS